MTLSKRIISLVLLIAFVGAVNAMDSCVRNGAKIGNECGKVLWRCAGFLVGIPAECGKYCYNKISPIMRNHPGPAVFGLAGVVAMGVVVCYVLRSRKAVVQRRNEVVDSVNQVAVPI